MPTSSRSSLVAGLTALLFAMSLVACGEEAVVRSGGTAPGSALPPVIGTCRADMGSVETHRDAWSSQGLTSYEYRLRTSGGERLHWSTVVRVVDGKVVEPEHNPLNGWPADSIDLTIDSWLAFLARQHAVPTIDTIAVTWDDATGIPLEIRLDPQCQAIDDEANYHIEGFKPVPSEGDASPASLMPNTTTPPPDAPLGSSHPR